MKMNLSVVMKTIDQASAPLKKINGEYGHFTPRVQKAQKALVSNRLEMLADIATYKKTLTQHKANSDQMAVATAKIAKYQAQIKAGKALSAAQIAQFNKAKAKLDLLSQAEKGYKKTLAKTGQALKKQGVNTKNLASEESRLGRELEANQKKLTAITRRYKALNSAISKVKKTAVAFSLGNMAKGFGAVNIAAAGAFALTTKVSEEADKLTKTAQNLKMPLNALQALQFQAEHAGVSADTMGGNMIRFTKRFGQLQAAGNGALGAYLKKSKNPLFGQLEHAKSTQDAYNLVLQSFSKLKTNQEQMAFADAAFGQDGRKMLIMLRSGTKGLTSARKEFNELGGGLTDEDAASAEAYNDALFDIKIALNSMKFKIITPLMKKLTTVFKDLITNFKNAKWRDKAIKKVTEAIDGLFSAVKTIYSAFKTLVDYFPEIVAGIALVKVAFFYLNAIMMANPIGLIVSLIATLVVALIYMASHWRKVKYAMKATLDTFKAIGKVIGVFASKVSAQFSAIGNTIVSGLISPFKLLISLLAKMPKSVMPDDWGASIESLNNKMRAFDETLMNTARSQQQFADAKGKSLQEHFNDTRRDRAIAEQTLTLTRSENTLVNLSGEYKGAKETRTVSADSIIKHPQVQSKSQVTLQVKSDLPVSIDKVQTDGFTNLNVDTGGLLDFGF